MKPKNFILSAACLALSLMASCSNDPVVDNNDFASWDASTYLTNDVLYPKNAKLKRVIFSPVWENVYEYDAEGRIYKIRLGDPKYMDYNLYAYNEKGLLSNISIYYSDTLEANTVFTYDDSGNKIKEETKNVENQTEMQVNPRAITYSYNNGKLVKSEEYFQYLDGTISHTFTKYEYNNEGELIRELLYVDDENDYSTTKYYYHEGLMFYSITYYKDRSSGFSSDSRRIYDLNGNLVKRIDNMPWLSNYKPPDGKQPPFYVTIEYEYYQ